MRKIFYIFVAPLLFLALAPVAHAQSATFDPFTPPLVLPTQTEPSTDNTGTKAVDPFTPPLELLPPLAAPTSAEAPPATEPPLTEPLPVSPPTPPPPAPSGASGEFPYKQKFVVSSYYTPLKGQNRYITGSFEGDVWLNGEGVHTADGTKVYPGTAAAPRRFPFRTKMLIPGFGTVAIHDRGGAIKGDRLDIWVGSGDDGLSRALAWGLRTVEVTVYGIDENIKESVAIESLPKSDASGVLARTRYFKQDLAQGDSGEAVRMLQRSLKKAGFYAIDVTGYYGEETQSSVLSFQRAQKVIDSDADTGAGNFGPRTRVALEAFLEQTKSQALERIPQGVLSRGSTASQVRTLQEILREYGFIVNVSGAFDEETIQAIKAFQLDQKLIANENDIGAGFYGPKTQAALEQLIASHFTPAPAAPQNVVRRSHGEVQGETAEEKIEATFTKELSLGDRGESVETLQEELVRLHFLGLAPTGYYGKTTQHAVFKFQQAFSIVNKESDEGAGSVGPKTLSVLNELVSKRASNERKIGRATEEHRVVSSRIEDEKKIVATARDGNASEAFKGELVLGSRGEDVETLQKILKKLGFFPGKLTSAYFGDITKRSLVAFQKSHGLAESGALDEGTRRIFNKLVSS